MAVMGCEDWRSLPNRSLAVKFVKNFCQLAQSEMPIVTAVLEAVGAFDDHGIEFHPGEVLPSLIGPPASVCHVAKGLAVLFEDQVLTLLGFGVFGSNRRHPVVADGDRFEQLRMHDLDRPVWEPSLDQVLDGGIAVDREGRE